MILTLRGKTPIIAPDVFVAENASIIGDVEIGEKSSIWYNTVLRGDVHEIRIGRECNIQDGTIIHATYQKCGTYLEEKVSIGHMVVLHGCKIGHTSLIGMGAIVMDNAVIPPFSLVGAGALVTENSEFPEKHLILGRPARAVRPLKEQELAFLPQSAANYIFYKTWYEEMKYGIPHSADL